MLKKHNNFEDHLKEKYKEKYFDKFSEIFDMVKNKYMTAHNLSKCKKSEIVKLLSKTLCVSPAIINKQFSYRHKELRENEKIPLISREKLLLLQDLELTQEDILELIFYSEAYKTSNSVLQHILSLEKRLINAEKIEIRASNMEEFVSKEILESLILFFKCKRDKRWHEGYEEIKSTIIDALSELKLMTKGSGDNEREKT